MRPRRPTSASRTILVVAPSADGRLELFLRGGDHNVYHAWQTSASNGWSDWVSEGAEGGGFIAGAPGLAKNGDGRLEIFAVTGRREYLPQMANRSQQWLGAVRFCSTPGAAAADNDGS